MKAVEIESDRLYFKPLGKSHASMDYVDWMNDPKVNRYLESGGDYNLQKLEIFLVEVEEKEMLFWAIHTKDDNAHIGSIKIDPINDIENTGEYGILIGDKNSWGKGYAEEATLRVLRFCFEKVKLSAITLGVISENRTALALYNRLGFKIIDEIRNFGVYNEEMCNCIRMKKINDK